MASHTSSSPRRAKHFRVWYPSRTPLVHFLPEPSISDKSTSYVGFPASGMDFTSWCSPQGREFPSRSVLPVSPACPQAPCFKASALCRMNEYVSECLGHQLFVPYSDCHFSCLTPSSACDVPEDRRRWLIFTAPRPGQVC